jgi:HAD superfamily hydrolase (TIGR01484 family)
LTASKVTAGLNSDFPVICYNGAFVIANATKEKLFANYFTTEDADYIRQTLAEHSIYPIVYAYIEGKEQFSFMQRNVSSGMRFFLDSRLNDVRRREVQAENELYKGDMFYFSCISNEAELAPVNDLFSLTERIHCIYQKDIYSGAQWCELLPARATKANAASQLKEMLGCDRLVVFGDGRNDLSLFTIADECYAMSNAVPELKEIATAVIGSNDEDGVARWLEENVL